MNNVNYWFKSYQTNYYPFMINLSKCNGSFKALTERSGKIWVLNKTEDVNLSVFNLITRKNEWKTLTKNILCKCECKFDGSKCNSIQMWNNNKYWCATIQEKMYTKKVMFRILLHVVVKMVVMEKALLMMQWLYVMKL